MTEETLLAFVKKSLRVASNSFDDEINALISAAEADITQATDITFDITDSVQCNAVAIYCQAHFGYGDDDAAKRYQQILQSIGLRNMGG